MRLPSEGRLSKFKEKGFGSLLARDRKFFPHVPFGPESFQKRMYSALRRESPPSKAVMKGSCRTYGHLPTQFVEGEDVRGGEYQENPCTLVQQSGMCQANTTSPSGPTDFHGWGVFSFSFPGECCVFLFFLTLLEMK